MEKAKGVLLSSKWPAMQAGDKHKLIDNIIDLERAFVAHPFAQIGSLYYHDSLPPTTRSWPTPYSGFVVGPTTDRRFFEDGRKDINADKGPCWYQ